jgi:hypothetical protein
MEIPIDPSAFWQTGHICTHRQNSWQSQLKLSAPLLFYLRSHTRTVLMDESFDFRTVKHLFSVLGDANIVRTSFDFSIR